MTYTYDHPLVIQSGPQELKIAKITTGTTQVELSDGRVLWLTLGVDSVTPNAGDPGAVDIKHSITVEMMSGRAQHNSVTGFVPSRFGGPRSLA